MSEKASIYKVHRKAGWSKTWEEIQEEQNFKVTASVLDSKFLSWIPALTSFDDEVEV